MKSLLRALSVTAAILLIGMVAAMTIQAQNRRLVQDRFATVGGVRLHYLEAGNGEPVILLHGYAQNSHMWRPLMIELAKTRLVIAPDLRGFGQSSKPDGATTRRPWLRTFMLSQRQSESRVQLLWVTTLD